MAVGEAGFCDQPILASVAILHARLAARRLIRPWVRRARYLADELTMTLRSESYRNGSGFWKWLPSLATSFAISCALMSGTSPLTAQAESSNRRSAIVTAIQQAEPATVNIHGRKTMKADSAVSGDTFKQVNGMGSGMIVDSRGYIVTNYHVVEGVGNIHVTLADQKTAVAKLVAHDTKTDLAVIKIDSDKPLPVVRMGTSSDLMMGETVIAIGNPYGYASSATRGIISRLHRPVQVTESQKYANLIQTDAPINPGNSGGPLINIDGEAIGITVAVRVGAQGIAFAIPIDEVLTVVERLVNIERVDGHRHGVLGESKTETDAKGFFVNDVETDSPAEKAGLKAGDRIVRVEDAEIVRGVDFELALLGREPETEIPVEVDREGSRHTIKLSLEGATAGGNSPEEERIWKVIGVRLKAVPDSEFTRLNSKYHGGMRVTSVRKGSPAEKQSIKTGNILVGLHDWETLNVGNVIYVLDRSDFERLQPLKFYVIQDSIARYGFMKIANRK